MAFLNSFAGDAERDAARTAILLLYRQVLSRPLDLPAAAPITRLHAQRGSALEDNSARPLYPA